MAGSHVLGVKIRLVTDLEPEKIIADDTLAVLNNLHMDVLGVVEWHT